MPRLRPLTVLAAPFAFVAFAAGCEQIAGIDGSFELQEGASGAGAGVGGTGGGEGGTNSVQGASGTGGAGGQAGLGGAGAGGGAVMGGAGNTSAGSAGGPPGPVATVLAEGQVNVRQIVSDGKTLFWVSAGTQAAGFTDGKVLSCPVTGCLATGPTVLAENQKKPEFLSPSDENYDVKAGAEAGRYIFWTTSLGGEVLRCEKTGCGGGEPKVLARNQGAPAGVRASLSLPRDNDKAEPVVFWADTSAGKILQCPDEGCGEAEPKVVVGDRPSPKAFLTGNSFVYWIEGGDGEKAGILYRYKKDQTTAEPPVAQTDPGITASNFELVASQLFAVDRGTLANQYADGQIRWADPLTDARDIFAQGQKNLHAIASDGTNIIYWNADGKLFSCAIGRTCATPQLVAEGVGASDLASDAEGVYFFVDGSIRKASRAAPTATTALRSRLPGG